MLFIEYFPFVEVGTKCFVEKDAAVGHGNEEENFLQGQAEYSKFTDVFMVERPIAACGCQRIPYYEQGADNKHREQNRFHLFVVVYLRCECQ